jgi:hypothetical protein
MGISLGGLGGAWSGRYGCRSAGNAVDNHPAVARTSISISRIFGVPRGSNGWPQWGQTRSWGGSSRTSSWLKLGPRVRVLRTGPFPWVLGTRSGDRQVIGAVVTGLGFGRVEEIGLKLAFSPSSCSTFCSNAAVRWGLAMAMAYPTCWRVQVRAYRAERGAQRPSWRKSSTQAISSVEERLGRSTRISCPTMTNWCNPNEQQGKGASFVGLKSESTGG